MRNIQALPHAGAIAIYLASGMFPAIAQTADLTAADALARRSACFKCHSVDK